MPHTPHPAAPLPPTADPPLLSFACALLQPNICHFLGAVTKAEGCASKSHSSRKRGEGPASKGLPRK